MNKVDIIRKHIGNDDFYDMNGTSMLTNILNAMEEYKEQEVKNCSIPDVGRTLVCDIFQMDISTSSATRCKCGREKWEHAN